MAEKYYRWTPYNYTIDNPLRFIDPNGMSTHTNKRGKIVAVYDDDDKNIYQHKGNGRRAKKEVEKNYSEKNTSGGGKTIGQTPTAATFLDKDGKTPSNLNVFTLDAAKIITNNSSPEKKEYYEKEWGYMVDRYAPEYSKNRYDYLRTHPVLNTLGERFVYTEPMRIIAAIMSRPFKFFEIVGKSQGPINDPIELVQEGYLRLLIDYQYKKEKSK